MPAERLFHEKRVTAQGAIIEMSIWRVPTPVPPSSHRLKYSLFYGVPGRRLVGFDNERGKGDHKHVGGQEHAYEFSTVEQLVADFLTEVARLEAEV
jgi:hypothetical protein